MTNNRGNAWGALIKGGGYPAGPPRIPHWLCFPGNETEFVRKLLCFSIEMKPGVRKGYEGVFLWGLLGDYYSYLRDLRTALIIRE